MNSYAVVIVTHKREKLLQRCLQSLITQRNSHEFPIIVVVNGKDSETALLLKNSFPQVKSIFSEERLTPGEARNRGAQEVESDYIIFLDDDTIVPFDYFETLEEILGRENPPEIFGGPDANYPNSTPLEKALSLCLKSPLATASTRFRHMAGHESTITTDAKFILCNMIIKTKLMKNELTFDKRFFRNEENVLLHIAKKLNITTEFFPNLFVYHKRKSTISGIFKAVLHSGAGRLKSFIFYPDSIQPIYFVPFFFSLYILSIVFCDLEALLYVPLYFYIVLNLYFSWKITKRKRSTLMLLRVAFLQFLINFTYGLGFLYEMIRRFIFLGR